MLMQDKNGKTMTTGNIVKIENAYFKNDNGYYFIANTPGDPSWCGNDYSLHKIGKRGKISIANYSIAFWPLWACCSDRMKNAAANDHNKKYATIEIITEIDNAEVIKYFEKKVNGHIEAGNTYKWRFGEESETTKKEFELAKFYQGIADSLKDTPEEVTEEPETIQEPEEKEKTPKMYKINEQTAERAWYAVHMGDYKKNSATNEYNSNVAAVQKLAEAQKKKVSEFYHDKIDALMDKYARRLAKWYDDYNRNQASCPSWFIAGPANYPVRKHERQMSRERSLWAEYDEIKGIKDRIKAVGTGAVDLADPHAKEMLTERIEKLTATLEKSKAINAYYRKHKTLIGSPDLSPEKAETMTKEIAKTIERCPWISQPVPAYELTSLRDKIKRTRERLEELEKRQNAEPQEDEQHEGFTVVRNTELDRLQILFDEIPEAETRAALKNNGFRWSPKNKAWQRQLTPNAERALKTALNI